MNIKFINQYVKAILWIVVLTYSLSVFSKETHSDLELQKHNNQQKQKFDCSMKFAWADWPPYLVAGKYEPSGIQIDLIKLISKKMNCQIIYKKLSWQDTIASIENGNIDFVGRASKFPEREKFAYFSQPYRDDLLVLTIRKNESKKYHFNEFQKLLDQGFKLGILKGGYLGEEVENLKRNVKYQKNFIEFVYEKNILLALANKKVDGIFEAPFTVDNAVMDNPIYNQLEEYPFEILAGELHFMFSKKTTSQKTVKAFNQALQEVKNSRAYKKHWFWRTIN